jgi:hypothetical protein
VSDPLRRLWVELEARGYGPHGKPYDFRARCPGHDGDNRTSLSVGVGADGRAVLWCHAHQCDAETITGALGLHVADLFPDGHYRGPRYLPRPVRRSDFRGAARDVANVLFALERLEEPWTLMITCLCPYCGAGGAWLRAGNDHVDVDCSSGGCGPHEFTQALLGRLSEEKSA